MAEFSLTRGSLKMKASNQLAQEILENNNLAKIEIPTEGRNNLFKALSFAIFMSFNEEQNIQTRLITQLKVLIQEKNLPLKLAMFDNDLMLFKDYCSNNHFHGFDKISLELACHCFEVRIVVYSISEESYLNSTIYNRGFEKTIYLLKSGTHFDVVVEKQHFELLSFAQNLVYESPYDKTENDGFDGGSPPMENKLKPKHKKSRSDNFNVNNEKMEEKGAYYNLFLNLQAPKDFLTSITPSNSSRFAKNFKSEQTKENEPSFRFSNLESQKNQLFNPFNKTKPFEPERDFLGQKSQTQSKPPMFFVGSTPPGLTPKKQGPPQMEEDPQIQLLAPKFKFPEKKMLRAPRSPQNEMSQFQNRNTFQPTQEQGFGNFGFKNNPQNSFLPFQGNNFFDQENSNNNYNFANEENNFQNTERTSSFPQKPDMNKINPFFYPNLPQNMPNIQQEELKQQSMFDPSQVNSKKTGRLKFFDEAKNYGFIIMDEDGSDIFVHYDDLAKAGVAKDLLRTAKQGNLIRFSFNCMSYIGKYNKSKKAVDLTLLNSFI